MNILKLQKAISFNEKKNGRIRVILSLCIPTNGVVQWVFPVLDSIFRQGVDDRTFEVVITDNGNNSEFKDKIREYLNQHKNIVYAETNALPFINEIESYKRANGDFIKFVNHRTMLVEGALQKLIDFASKNIDAKPVTYFSNGAIKLRKDLNIYSSFDEFVKNLSYLSSWSTGMSMWKTDLVKLLNNTSDFNELFPHTNILFSEKDRDIYVIDNSVIFEEKPQGKIPKGDYDLYNAFGIEYPKIIEDLFIKKYISKDTFKFVLDQNLEFIASLYFEYNCKKKYCSYNISGIKNIFGKYYSRCNLINKLLKLLSKKILDKFFVWI